jgi:hypothetical protein
MRLVPVQGHMFPDRCAVQNPVVQGHKLGHRQKNDLTTAIVPELPFLSLLQKISVCQLVNCYFEAKVDFFIFFI